MVSHYLPILPSPCPPYPWIAVAMAPASVPKGRHGSVDAFTNCAWPCHCSAFLRADPLSRWFNIWGKKTSSPIYWEMSESFWIRSWVPLLNLWSNLGPCTTCVWTVSKQLWHHHSTSTEPSGRDNKLPIWLHTWGSAGTPPGFNWILDGFGRSMIEKMTCKRIISQAISC